MFFPKLWLKSKSDKIIYAYYLLLPLTFFWRLLLKIKIYWTISEKMPVPVICVGNLTIGGNGKTPTALKLQKLLENHGYSAHILSKGYKSRLKGPIRVNPDIHNFMDVGDEPLMMSLHAPTWVARDRRLGIKAACQSGADVVIMDDGFQNNSVKKDFSLLVVDTSVAFGNENIIPAGPLREPIAAGLKRADLLITIGDESNQNEFYLKYGTLNFPKNFNAVFVQRAGNINLKGKKVIAVAGIGHPEKFFQFIRQLGAELYQARPFPNHKAFSQKSLEELKARSLQENVYLVTTEKDFVRLPLKYRPLFKVLEIELAICDEKLFLRKVLEKINLC